MRIQATAIPDLYLAEINAHKDSRGFFTETWRDTWAAKLHFKGAFVQDNHARSEKAGVLRGLHFQAPPAAQAKLVWVTRGAVYDVAVDIRKNSPTYGQWHGVVLSEANMLRFFVPEGFAHGYLTLEAGTEVQYKVSTYYSAEHEGGIRYDDPQLNIAWPDFRLILSDKDKSLPLIKDFASPFSYRNKQ